MHPSDYPTLNAGLYNYFFLLSIMRLLVNLLLQCPEDPWCNTPVLQSIRYFSKNFVFPTSLLKFHSISSSRGSLKTRQCLKNTAFIQLSGLPATDYYSFSPSIQTVLHPLCSIFTVSTFSVCLQVDYVRSC